MAGDEDIARWRQAAEYARQEASACPDRSLREHWLEIARSYEQLIRDALAPLRPASDAATGN